MNYLFSHFPPPCKNFKEIEKFTDDSETNANMFPNPYTIYKKLCPKENSDCQQERQNQLNW